MKKYVIKYCTFILLFLFVGIGAVKADFHATTNGDVVTLDSGNSYALGFYYNTQNSYNSATNVETYGYRSSSTAGTAQISLKNGTYHFWVVDSGGGKRHVGPYIVNTSCTNDNSKVGQTSTFTVERCYRMTSSNSTPVPDQSGTVATCADGYYLDESQVSVYYNGCNGMSMNNMKLRYCRVILKATCVKSGGEQPPKPPEPCTGSGCGGGEVVPAATLSYLDVSDGELSPAFKSGTKKYTVNVSSAVSSVNINAGVNGGSFVNGYGPRSVDLNYGSNTVQIKVKNSAGKTTTYTIYVVRADGRSSVNTLSNIVVSEGTLEPEFSSTVNEYIVRVSNSSESITVNATLTDGNSKFEAGYGPGTYTLNPGNNVNYLKVVSEKGETNVYSINVIREEVPSECTTDTTNLALLKGIRLSVDMDDVAIDQIADFDPQMKTYSNIKVPYKVTNLTVDALVQDEEDKELVVVEGAGDLEVNIPKTITITVTSKKCPNYQNIYTLNVTRQSKYVASDDSSVKNIIIKGHEDEYEFKPNEDTIKIILNKGEDHLDIDVIPVNEKAKWEVEGNSDLKVGSEITIRVFSEDEEYVETYTVVIDGVRKGANVFLIIIIVIIIILLLVYLLLRLLGYRIYFNFGAVGDFFRGITDKFKNE